MKIHTFASAAIFLILCSSASAQWTTFCPANANSTGIPAVLTGSYGTGVGSGLHLEVHGGVPGQFGYLLVGDEVSPATMVSMGLLCLGGMGSNVYRYNISGTEWDSIGVFNGAGIMVSLAGNSGPGYGYDVPAVVPDGMASPIMFGDTWHFQAWYRDGAASSNFSNGLSVTFNPSGVVIPWMVAIPAGTFQMGSNAATGPPYFGGSFTQPVHTVTISQNFWMSDTEVTQAQYQGLMGTNPSSFVGPNLPVERVSWHDARAYCAALTAQEQALGNVPSGFEYRLPTEAEWEYACRAGTTSEFHFGPRLFCEDARSFYSHHSFFWCNSNRSVAVASYVPNAFGLYDMHGNVMEWCLDTYAFYGAGSVTDPFVTNGWDRVVRGGNWRANSNFCRSAHRTHYRPLTMSDGIGFRVVLAPVLVP